MELIDTHGHVYYEQYGDFKGLIERMIAEGVKQVFMPGLNKKYQTLSEELEQLFPKNCFSMIGLHPCYVKEDVEEELAAIELSLNKRDYIAIGEIGFDLYWDKTFIEEQKMAFRKQISWAKEKNTPINIHCRDAFDLNLEELQKAQDGSIKGVWHCFAESLERAKLVTEAGMLLGINGIVTFKNGGLDKVLPHISPEHIVLETDCPYLAPVPYRGKQNEPAYLPYIAQKVADLMGLGIEELASITTANAKRVYQTKKNETASL